MSNLGYPSTSAHDFFQDDEIFEDSTFLANFDNAAFMQTKVPESNVNDSANTSALNVSALCCDEEISGYDKLTGRTWIYPTNYPVRDYQFNIIKAALLKNTLVSLPTGLGKTFIAAVIMYNFYRWYPLGKIVFTAPTRPLVAQQIDACYNIIAIPPNDTIEMTGHMQVNTRKAHWQSKRVFFATPQVIYNDIKSGICPAEKIRCLVIDEAHRARGNYAYCQIVATLDEMGHKTYRMLALSATPGSKVDDVINVVRSLHIAHLELRTENCIDVAPYSHARKISTVIVPLGPELSQLRQHYVEILDGYARRLKQFNILPQNLGNLSKGRIVMLYKEYQTKDRGNRHPQHNHIMKDFTILIALYHGLELLVKHGCRVFLNFFDEHPEKAWIQADDRLTALLERLRDDLGINPLSLDRSMLPDGTIPEMPKDLCFGHPKFDKLKSIIMDHFTNAKQNKQDTRAIIFCEYRESVNLVHCLLLQCRPLISPQMFVGQGASGKDGKTVVSQKQQLRVMRSFREGQCNTLVATCVAEEGLDVGSVDLIICFDISTRSPIRLVQRCGRTGRERGGQVYILVTEGREHQTLMDCMRQRDGLNKKILQSREVENNLYKANPRMMPRDFTPECQKMYITVDKKHNKDAAEKPAKKGQKDLRSMLLNSRASSGASSSSKEADTTSLINEDDFRRLYPHGFQTTTRFQKPKNYWAMSKETVKARALNMDQANNLNLANWLEWQRTLQKTVNVKHSKDSEFLVNILQKCDAKRLESSQNPVISTQEVMPQNVIAPVMQSPIKLTKQTKKKQKVPVTKSPGKNNGDIRALFSTATKSTKNYTKLINDLGIQNDGSVPTKLLNLLVDLSLNVNNSSNTKKCYVCDNFGDCKTIKEMKKTNSKPVVLSKFLSDPTLPDIYLIDEINAEAILKCRKGESNQNISNYDVKNVSTISKNDNANCSGNFDLEFDLDVLVDLNSPEAIVKPSEANVSSDKNFDLGDINDIFAESSPEDAIEKKMVDIKNTAILNEIEKPTQTQEALGFFGLNSIDDIFADYEDDQNVQNTLNDASCHKNSFDNLHPVKNHLGKSENVSNEKVKETIKTSVNEILEEDKVPACSYPLSPSILTGKQIVKDIPISPILCTQPRKFQLSTKKNKPQSSTPNSSVKRKLSLSESDTKKVIVIEDVNKNRNPVSASISDTVDKSMLTITQIVDMINKTNDKTQKEAHNITVKVNKENERCVSPIILTQADRRIPKKLNNAKTIKDTKNSQKTSLIILDSDSDSDFEDTQSYNIEEDISKYEKDTQNSSKIGCKRKGDSDESLAVSPYFPKKQKLDDATPKTLTLQEKVLAAITSNKIKENPKNYDNNKTIKITNNQTSFHFTVSQANTLSQKENQNTLNGIVRLNIDEKEKEEIKPNPVETFHKFRKESKILTLRKNFETMVKKSPKKIESPKKNSIDSANIAIEDRLSSPIQERSNNKENTPQKKKIFFDDSDDDFVHNEKASPKKTVNKRKESRSTTNHKVRKKRKHNSFIELEASLTDDDADSGDELTDDSAGSIVDFICDDDDVTKRDIYDVYLKSIRSPVRKNGFKIPELPQKFRREDIFSQLVEEDAYEMDSFCVDSHVGLTQINDHSDLELAEIVLESERRSKKKVKLPPSQTNGDSPLVRRIKKRSKRQIDSDSENSSE